MTDREYYEKRVRPLLPGFGSNNDDDHPSWDALSEIDKAQIAEIRIEEQRIP